MLRHSIYGFLLLASCAYDLRAQAVSGTIYGFVLDQTSAAVQAAVVTARNVDTNYVREMSTEPSGEYRFVALPLGHYTLSVRKAGFTRFVQEGIVLQVDQQIQLDVSLRVGNVTDEVVVMAEAPQLNTTNAEVSEVIDRRRVEELPLNGRNFTQLIQLTSGATPGTSGDNSDTRVINLFRAPTFFTANGMRNMYNNFILDGVDNNEDAFNAGGVVILPVIDGVQEFKVATGNFSSEFGRAVGGIVNVQTRSGTNALHGNLFEFLRNSDLDANDFFNNANGRKRPAFGQNQFGGTIGGPIRKDSLFVFADYQGFRQHTGLTLLGSVPTPDARQGDFSNPLFPAIYDPLTTRPNPAGGSIRDPFPNKRVPSNRFDPLVSSYLQLIPSPNTNLNGIALNFINNPNWERQTDQGDIRVDKSLGAKGTVFLRYSAERDYQLLPNELTTPQNPFGGGGRSNNLGVSAHNAVINLNYVATPHLVLEGRLGFSRFVFDGHPLGDGNPLAAPFLSKVPGSELNPLAKVPPGLNITGMTAVVTAGGLPNLSIENNFDYVFNATWNHGRHSVKTGTDAIRHQRNNFINSNPVSGLFFFSPSLTNQTGLSGGGVGFASFLLGIPNEIQRGVVLNMAGRRNLQWGAYVQDDIKVTENFTVNLGIRYELFTPITEVADRLSILDVKTGKLIFPGDSGPYGRGLLLTDKNNFAPRFGLAYKVPGAPGLVMRAGYGISYIEEFGSNRLNNALNPPFAFSQDIIYSTIDPPPARIFTGIPTPAPAARDHAYGDIRMVDPTTVAAYAQQWNFGVQRQFGANWLLDAAYVGTKGTHLLQYTDHNQPTPGPGDIASRRPLYLLNPDVTPLEDGKSVGNSVYHSLQVKVNKSFSHGVYFLASYTYSKNIDDGDGNFNNGGTGQAQNPNNYRAERSLASTDIPQRLVSSFGWELPFGKGKQFLAGMGRWNSLVGGWQIAGISTFSDGSPFDVTLAVSTLNTGGFQRPNRIAGGHLAEPTISHYFDLAAFQSPGPFLFGNSGRNILRGPGLINWDLSAVKKNTWKDRYQLEFRAELFNAFNRADFDLPGNSIGTPQAGVISSTRPHSYRQIQFAIKLFF